MNNDTLLRTQRKESIPIQLVIQQELHQVIACSKNLDYPIFLKGHVAVFLNLT